MAFTSVNEAGVGMSLGQSDGSVAPGAGSTPSTAAGSSGTGSVEGVDPPQPVKRSPAAATPIRAHVVRMAGACRITAPLSARAI